MLMRRSLFFATFAVLTPTHCVRCCPFCHANRLQLFGQKGNVRCAHSNSLCSLLSVLPSKSPAALWAERQRSLHSLLRLRLRMGLSPWWFTAPFFQVDHLRFSGKRAIPTNLFNDCLNLCNNLFISRSYYKHKENNR